MPFDAARLLNALSLVQGTQGTRLPTPAFITIWVQLAQLLPLLGPALAFAAMDVNNKLDTVKQHLHTFKTNGVDVTSLYTLMRWEVDQGCAHSSYATPSLTRSVQRLLWMLDFVQTLLTRLMSNPEESVHAAAAVTYDERLKDKHRWLVQQAVKLGLYACPSRSTLNAHLAPELQHQLAHLLRAPVNALHSFFTEFQLGTVE